MATPAEQAVLVRYVGWGAFAQDVFADHKPEWAKERNELKGLLSIEEYESARASVLNAHYTSADVIKGMWDAMLHLGVSPNARALEPASGVGHFLGLAPINLRWTTTELDHITGQIAKQLYQAADVNVQGFETLNRPNGFYDLAISNVPFGSFNIRDTRYRDQHLIHDYFFIRALDLVRPGGVVAFITSSGTMDKVSDSARSEIMKRGSLIGAIRLPGGKKGAFAGNAGTEVTTDIIFLSRRGDRIADAGHKWKDLKEIQTPDGPTSINEYFADHPEMMLGEMHLTGTMYRDKSPVLVGDATNLQAKIAEAAKRMQGDAMMPQGGMAQEAVLADAQPAAKGAKEGAYYVEGGRLLRKVIGVATEPGLSKVDQEKVRSLVVMRDLISGLLDVNRDRSKDVDQRKRLNSQYDAFVKRFGPINKEVVTVTSRLNKAGDPIIITRKPNMSAFSVDPDAFKVAAIENYDSETGKASKAALFQGDVVSANPSAEIKNAVDGIGWSLNSFGELNLTAVADRLGKTKDQIIEELGERIYENPNGETWQPAEQYLSGDVVEKLEQAHAAAKADPRYQRNVAALEKVQPTPLSREEITVPFGAAWVPASVIEQFLEQKIGTTGSAKVFLNKVTKQFALGGVNFSMEAQTQFGTAKVDVAEIVSHALAMKSPRVTQKFQDANGTKELVDEDATRQAQIKTQQVRKLFEGDSETGTLGWVWEDDGRAELLERLYNHKFNRLVPQRFDGSHLTLPGLATQITDSSGNLIPFELRPHQKSAVWRMVQNGNTLLDHVVGAGKTFTMIAGGMEMKRLGMVQRPMYVVPNHMLEQFSREFLQAYPNANILVAQKEEMTKANRKAFAAKIAAERWDGIVITHDAFGRLPLSRKAYEDFIKEEIAEIESAIRESKALAGKADPTVKQLEQMRKRAEARLKDLVAEERKDNGVLFEELGVDMLFVDEAHLFKNLSFYTQHTRVKGLAQGNSQRATDLFLKVRELEKTKPGRAAIFATGTPISNTMAEMFTMQRYLQLDELVKMGLDRFDAWAATFGEIRTNMELSPDGRTFRETSSFSRFRNLPELVALYSKMADTKTAEMLQLPRPKLKGGKPIVVEAEPSGAEEAYISQLVQRAEQVRGKKAEKGGDNMLKVVSEGRKVALDYRLIDPEWGAQNPTGKVALAVNNITRIWKDGTNDPVAKAQIVFLDMGVPFSESKVPAKVLSEAETLVADETAEEVAMEDSEALRARYNLYEEIRRQLVAKGIPKAQVAFIHEATDDTKKAAMFEKVRRGDIRVLIGSTGKMGVGTNVQKRLKAMHHLDAPWKPAEVEQRDGRILRQGNLNPEIEIYRYITKRSFDSFMWQTLERKANFIAQIKAGARGVRIAEDIDSPLPEAAELKAAASGDPRIMEHAELTKEVRDLDAQFQSHARTIVQARKDAALRREELAGLESQLPRITEDAAKVPNTKGDAFKVDLLVGSKATLTKRAEAGAAIVEFVQQQYKIDPWHKGSFNVASFNGLVVKLNIRPTSDGPALSFSVQGYNGKGDEFGLAPDRTPALDTAMASRMERELAEIPSVKIYVEHRIDELQKSLPKLEALSQSGAFPKQERLKEAKQRLADLTKALTAEKDKNPAPGEQLSAPVVKANVVGKAPVFYSALLRTVESLKMGKAPAAQWLATIKNQQGVKAEEISWLGLDDWLRQQSGPITKQQLADFIRANQVQVQEVLKGAKGRTFDTPQAAKDFIAEQTSQDVATVEDTYGYSDDNDYITLAESMARKGPTEARFAPYQLPGGKNYRELLLTLPIGGSAEYAAAEQAATDAGNRLADWHRAMNEKYGTLRTRDTLTADERLQFDQLEREAEQADNLVDRIGRESTFMSNHWAEPNILAHIRFNERTGSKGERILFLEEIQSDWHQKGRKQGYGGKFSVSSSTGRIDDFFFKTREEAEAEIERREIEYPDAMHQIFDKAKGVPDAPFKTTWPELALKRMVRWAAENGFDQVSWTPGQVQADRYDLSKQIASIELEGDSDALYVTAYNHSNQKVFDTYPTSLENLPNLIGKEAAEKLLAQRETTLFGKPKVRKLSGLDLKVGGEGMIAFYDKMLVDAANKLGKKFGAKVERTSIPGEKKNAVTGWESTDARVVDAPDIKAHTLPITPEMRSSAMQGVPLFQTAEGTAPAFSPTREQVRAFAIEARRLTQQILNKKVVSYASDRMPYYITKEMMAAWVPSERTIYYTMMAAHDIATNVGHESLHALRDLGLISREEWTALVAMTKKYGHIYRPTGERLAQWRRAYVDQMGFSEERFAEAMEEEAVADMLGDYVNAREKVTPFVRRIIDRLIEWANAMMVAMKLAGIEGQAEHFMAQAYKGNIGRRRNVYGERSFYGSRPVAANASEQTGERMSLNVPDDGGAFVGGIAPEEAADNAEAVADLKDLAGNIRLSRIKAPDDIKDMLRHVAKEADGFMGERRGVQSNPQTAALASEMGMSVKELLERKTGEAWNAEKIFAARSLLLKSAKRVQEVAQIAQRSASLSDLAEFQKAVLRHRAIQEQIAGLTAEAGRALQQFNMIAGQDYLRGLDAIMSGIKNRKTGFGTNVKGEEEIARELAQMIADLNDPAKIGKFVADLHKATIWDMVREAWINGILSGPRTHATNILSNTLTALWQVPETAIAGAIGSFHGGEKVEAGEAAARLVGLIEGTKEGLVAAAHMLKTGEPKDAISKVELHERRAIPGIAGSAIRVPSRLLESEDQFFKAVNYRAEINALALRQAMAEGKKGKALAARVAELRAKPSGKMEAKAHQAALYNTFQTKLGRKGQIVMNLREAIPLGWLIMPFIRTPANILKYAAERTPLGLAMRPVRDNLSGKNGNVARDTQIARLFLGTSVMVAVMSLAVAGSITGGGPDDPDEERILRATGWQPYSVKIGDTYYSYQRLDPIALVLGVAADLVQISEHVAETDLNKIASLLVNAIASNIKEKTWISGAVGFMEAFFSGDAWRLDAWGRRLGGSIVPAGVAQVAQWMDPQLREARTLVDTIKSRLPGYSTSLTPRRDVFGVPIVREGALGPDLFSSIALSTEKDNPAAKEMLALQYYPSMPNRIVMGHKLTPEQYDRYLEISGSMAKERLLRRMKLESWRLMDDDRKIDTIKDVFTEARRIARERVKREWPELRKKADGE